MEKIKQTIIAIALVLTANICFGSVISDVSNSGYSVLTNGSFSTGNNVSIVGNVGAGGYVWLADYTNIDGDLSTNNGVSTGSFVTVDGDLNYNSSFWMPSSSTVSGDVSSSSWQAPSIAAASVSSGSQGLYYASNSTVNLTSGSYNSLTVAGGSTVYLSSGTYSFSSAWFDSNVKIIADTSNGDVIINTAQSFSTSQFVSLTTFGNGNAYIVSAGSFSIDQHNEIAASLIANTTGSVANSSTIEGVVYASSSLWFGNDVNIGGLTASVPPTVPEPATALLLISAIPFVRNRIKKNSSH